MATLEELQKKRQSIIQQIQKKGGKGNAPNLSKQLDSLDKEIGGLRKSGGGSTPTTGGEDTLGTAIGQTNRITQEGIDYGKNLLSQLDPYLSDAFKPLATGSTPEMRAYLDRLNQYAQTAGNLTPEESFAIEQLRAGLNGYSSAELQGQREMARHGLDQDLATQLRQQALMNARNRVRGGAATAGALQLQQNRQQAGSNLERDLFVKNADEMQKRRLDFSTLIRQTEDARFGRKQSAEGLYGNQLTGEEGVQRGIEQYNQNQATNAGLLKSGIVTSGAGAFNGLISGQEAINQQGNYIQQSLAAQKAEADQRAEMERRRIQEANNAYSSVGV